MVQASSHVDALTKVVVDLLIFGQVGLVKDCEPFTAEHEVVDSISDFGRECQEARGRRVAFHATIFLASVLSPNTSLVMVIVSYMAF